MIYFDNGSNQFSVVQDREYSKKWSEKKKRS